MFCNVPREKRCRITKKKMQAVLIVNGGLYIYIYIRCVYYGPIHGVAPTYDSSPEVKHRRFDGSGVYLDYNELR